MKNRNTTSLILAAASACFLSAVSAVFSFAQTPSGEGQKERPASFHIMENPLAGYCISLPATSYFCRDTPLSGSSYDFYAQLYGIDSPYPAAFAGFSPSLPAIPDMDYLKQHMVRLSKQGYSVSSPRFETLGNGRSYWKLSAQKDGIFCDLYIRKVEDRFSFLTFEYQEKDNILIHFLLRTMVPA